MNDNCRDCGRKSCICKSVPKMQAFAPMEEMARLRAELAELRARVKEVPRTTEWHIAMREANQIHDADAYFAARSEMLDSGHNRHLFEAGYQRGFDAGEKVYEFLRRTP